MPDEAYSVRLQWGNGGDLEVYDPAAHFHATPVDAKIHSYPRQDGVLSYTVSPIS